MRRGGPACCRSCSWASCAASTPSGSPISSPNQTAGREGGLHSPCVRGVGAQEEEGGVLAVAEPLGCRLVAVLTVVPIAWFSETKALGDAVGFGSAFLFASVFGT
ncbi:hypothetical protein ACQJBY_042464 [Aegilops geniculata]